MGAVAAIVFANFGASYGMAKSGVGIMAAGVLRPDNMIKSLTPTIMAGRKHAKYYHSANITGILSIYGLVVAIQVSQSVYNVNGIPLGVSFLHLSAGLSVGLSSLAAGFAIGIVGDAGVRAFAQQPRLFVGMILIMIFAEVLGLYGMLIGLLLLSKNTGSEALCKP